MSQKINIDIITEYKGGQHVKKAESDLGGLKGAFGKLAGAAAAAFSVQKITEFGKAAVEAFAADQKSAAILSKTLDNLGLSVQNVPVEEFITKLSELNGVAKTDLRSAFDTLVRSTGDATKAQDLLNLGLDVSAGTGKDLALVSTALAKGYAGNFAALSKLGAGITATELKSKNFAEIQKHLASVFAGDASTAAETFDGKVKRLKTSYEEFKIVVGKGIVDAFSTLGDGGKLQGFQDSMAKAASFVADVVRGFAVVLVQVENIGKKINSWTGGTLGKILGKLLETSIFASLAKIGKADQAKKDLAAGLAKRVTPGTQDIIDQANAKKLLATQQAQLAAQKAISDQKAKQAALDRASLSLKLAGQTTDMQNIEIQAALQRGQSEQVVNVLLLQRAILTGNADQANILAQEVLRANGLVMDVNGNISSLATAKNPFADWPQASDKAKSEVSGLQAAFDALNMDALAARIKAINDSIKALNQTVDVNVNTGGTSSNGASGKTDTSNISKGAMGLPVPGAPIKSSVLVPGGSSNATDLAYAVSSANQMPGYNPAMELALNGNRGGSSNPINVTVNLDGRTVSGAITNVQVDQSASGINPTFNRSGYFAGLNGQ